MLPVQELMREPGGLRQMFVSESFFYLNGPAVVTIVASLSFMDPKDLERITEWRAYWAAFGEDDPSEAGMDARSSACASRGSKLPEAVARAIFPFVDGPYNS